MYEGRIYAFHPASLASPVSVPPPVSAGLHIFHPSFFIFRPGLQGAKSFVRDRNGLRISARASPICAAVLAGEILKALGGIKEILLRDASGLRGFTPSFVLPLRNVSLVIHADPRDKLFVN